MALLDVKATKMVTITCCLEQATALQVDRYAAWKEVHADTVVNKALEYVFSKDREFQQHLEENGDAKVASSLRVKKPVPAAGKAKQPRRPQLTAAQ